MTPDELRALADALDRIARTHVMIAHDEWETQHRAADYLRAQADAHPAPHYAMLDSHRRLVEQSIWDAEHPSGMSTHDGKARIDASVLRRMLAIIDSLPAAPQEGNVWKQIIPDNVPQAEPKREPLTALRILEIEDDANRKWRDNGRIIEYAVVFARMIEHAHGISGGGND